MRIGRNIRTDEVNTSETLRRSVSKTWGKVEVRLGLNRVPILGVGNGIKGWNIGGWGWNIGVRIGKVGAGELGY